MALPAHNNKIWSDLITGAKVINFEFLALKIFLGTAQRNYKSNPATLPKLAQELFQILEQNQSLPSAKKDIDKLG